MDFTANHNQEIEWIIRDKYNGNPPVEKLDKDIARLQAGEPIDYIIGFRNFLNCKIDLSYKPLIPREETEYWVENFIDSELQERKLSELKILDIFSGSGCIGISVAKHSLKQNPDNRSRIDFAEKNLDLLKQIEKNLRVNKIPYDKYRIFQSDLFSKIDDKYDYILANPPYVEEDEPDKLQKSVYNYEPHEALFGGPDGLDIIKKFLKEAKDHLLPKGKIFMEFGKGQKEEIEKILVNNSFQEYRFHKDQHGLYRWIKMR